MKNRMGEMSVLANVVSGYQEAKTIMVSCKLGIFDLLADDGLGSVEIATRLSLDNRAAEILLNALCALALLEKRDGFFFLSPLSSRYLVRDRPDYLGGLFRHQNSMWDLWSNLEEVVKGAPVARRHKKFSTSEFVQAMDANARRNGPTVVESVDVREVRRLLDLGGGPGTYSRLFLGKNPTMEVTVLDLPEVIEACRDLRLNQTGGPIRYRSGNFLADDLGSNYDLIWASHIIHSLAIVDIERLIQRCHHALAPGGRLLIHDFFLDESGHKPARAAVFSLHMLVVTPNGQSYRLSEITRLMKSSSFCDIGATASFENSSILQGHRRQTCPG